MSRSCDHWLVYSCVFGLLALLKGCFAIIRPVAIFRSAFLTAGLSGDYGGTWTLPRIVGTAKAKELYLMNKKIRADEAKRIGYVTTEAILYMGRLTLPRLVSEVFPQAQLMDEVLKVAKEIAAAPQLALRRIKANLNEADENLRFSTHLDTEADRHARSGAHPDAAEAGRAFIEKRAPKFEGVDKQEDWRVAKL